MTLEELTKEIQNLIEITDNLYATFTIALKFGSLTIVDECIKTSKEIRPRLIGYAFLYEKMTGRKLKI